MDLKTVQQLLKADIVKHQAIMTKLKAEPQNEMLRASLKEVQRHIADLGTKQKQLKISGKSSTNSHTSPKLQNGSTTNNSVTSQPASAPLNLSRKDAIKTAAVSSPLPGGSFPSPGGTTSSEGTVSVPPARKDSESFARASVITSTAKEVKPSTSVNSSTTATSGSSEPRTRQEAQTAIVTAQPTTRVSTPQVASQRNRVSGAPVQFQVPVSLAQSNNNTFVLVPSSMSNTETSSAVLRLLSTHKIAPKGMQSLPPTPSNQNSAKLNISCHQRPASRSASGSAHVWFNVAKSTSRNQRPANFIPAALRSTTVGAVGAFQKFRILEGRLPPGVQHILPASSPSNSAPSVLAEVPSTSAMPESSLGKSFANIDIEPPNKKSLFMSELDLLPTDKVDRIRNRRYGRRRSVAHPVYSGGIYVSTGEGDTPKRLLPPELLGIEDIPIKRPRGRPRGSGKNSNPVVPTPSQVGSNEVREEVAKILESSRPTTSRDSSGASKRVKRRMSNGQILHDEDHCAVCGDEGEVLMCDTCSLVYHLKCLEPPLKVVPTGMWICARCKKQFSDRAVAPRWSGLMAIVHSYFAFDSQRQEALQTAHRTSVEHQTRKSELQQKVNNLATEILKKVAEKNRSRDSGYAASRKLMLLMSKMQKLKRLIDQRIRHPVTRVVAQHSLPHPPHTTDARW